MKLLLSRNAAGAAMHLKVAIYYNESFIFDAKWSRDLPVN